MKGRESTGYACVSDAARILRCKTLMWSPCWKKEKKKSPGSKWISLRLLWPSRPRALEKRRGNCECVIIKAKTLIWKRIKRGENYRITCFFFFLRNEKRVWFFARSERKSDNNLISTSPAAFSLRVYRFWFCHVIEACNVGIKNRNSGVLTFADSISSDRAAVTWHGECINFR